MVVDSAVSVALSAVVDFIPQATCNVWDGLGSFWNVLLAVVGIIYIYRQNGGADGQHFLQRYLVIGWVVLIRCCVAAIILIAVVFFSTGVAVGGDTEVTHWYDFLFFAAGAAGMCWRIGHHVRDLALRTTAA